MTGLFMLLAYLLLLLQLQAYWPWLPWLILACLIVRYVFKTGVIDMSKYRNLTNFDEVMTKVDDPQKLANHTFTEEVYDNLGKISEEHIFGQDQVVKPLLAKIRANVEIPGRERPIVSALLVGEPGVGKSTLAKHISAAIANHPQSFLCIDSSQYKDHDSSSLFGTGKGYIGSDSPGSVINWLKAVETGVILIDEPDRVHGDPKRWIQTFMSFMEGKVTEVSTQQEFSTRNTLLFFASNYEHEKLGLIAEKYHALRDKMPPAELEAAMRKEAMAVLEGPVFPRAFLDRLDFIGIYRPLSKEVMADIVLKETAILTEQHGMQLDYVHPNLLAEAIRVGQAGASTGARDFKRWVAQHTNAALLAARRQGAQRVKLALASDRTVYATITAYREVQQTSSTGA